MKVIFYALLLISLAVSGQEGIFPDEAPALEHIWTRIGDVSPALRSVEAAEFSPDGLCCVSGSKFGYLMTMWNTADGSIRWQEKSDAEIECVSFSPDGKLVASGDEAFFVNIRNAASGELIIALEHGAGIDGLAWSPDGTILAAGTEEGNLVLWDRATWKQSGKRNCGSTINSIDFTSSESHVVVGGNNQVPRPDGSVEYQGFVTSFTFPALEPYRNYIQHAASVKSVRLSGNDSLLASGSFDSTACLWNFHGGELIRQIKESHRIEAVAFTYHDHFLVTGGQSPSTRFYNTKDFSEVARLSVPRVEYIDISSDGRLLLLACEDGGLLRLFMFLSQLQDKGDLYHKIADKQLDNRDLEKE